MKNKGIIRLGALIVASATLLLSGCGSQSDAGSTASAGQTKQGGTLTILSSSTDMDMDPAKSQGLPTTSNGYIFRRLTTWKVDRKGQTKVVPDLATDTGTTTDGGRTWKYTLKKGLKYEDGTSITSQDIKYGLERSFADSLTGGLSYHKTLLEGAQNYHGPFDGKSLDSIETPDSRTIVFHLNSPFGDWPWVASMATFTPVPKDRGSVQGYGKKPVSSGPYKVETNESGKQLILVRNKYWSRKTDKVRTAGPDKIVWKLGQDASVSAQAVMQGTDEGKNAFLSSFVPPAQLAQAQANPEYSKLLVTSGDGALEYLAINTKRVTNLKVRQAIEYGVNKESYRTAKGGRIAGNYASTLITPGVEGRVQYNLYKAKATGDVAKAKKLLKESGQIIPTLKLIATSDQAEVASAIQTSLKRIGIKVNIQTLDSEVFSDAETNDEGDYDLVIGGWQPDFPSPYANLSPLFDSSQIGHGNYNLSRYANDEVDGLIKKATETVDTKEAGKIWAQADKRIMQDAAVVPLLYSHNTFIHGSNVDNFYVGSFPAYPNYLTVSLKSGN